MRTAFQVIKAFAIVFAIMIIVSIIGAVVVGVESLGLIGSSDREIRSDENYANVYELDVNVKTTELRIVEADNNDGIRVETTSKYIDQWLDGETLHVVERSHGIFGWNAAGVTTIYVRKNAQFEDVRLEVGAGTLLTETDINAKTAHLNFGAGHVVLAGLYVSEQADIKTGAGLLEIQNGKIQDLNLDLGVGKAELNVRLTGDNHIRSGTGKLDLDLLGNESEYNITVKKGIGSVTLNGEDLANDVKYGDGANRVQIESGVGAVEIKTGGTEK